MLSFQGNLCTIFVILGVYIIITCGWSGEFGNATWQWESFRDGMRRNIRRSVNIENIRECNHDIICHGFTEVATVAQLPDDVTNMELLDLVTWSLYPIMVSSLIDRAGAKSVCIVYDHDSAWMIRGVMYESSIKYQLYNVDLVSVHKIPRILEETIAAIGGENAHEYLILTICSPRKAEVILQSVNALNANKRNQSAVRHLSSWIIVLPKLTVNDFEVTASRINNVLVLSEATGVRKKYKTMSVKTLTWQDTDRKFSNVGLFRTWTETSGHSYMSWIFRSTLFPNSRFGLNREILKIAILPWPPFVYRLSRDNETIYNGMCIDILHEMALRLNFTYNLIEPEDQQWGTLVGGRWTGIAGLVADEVVDLAVTPFIIQTQRLLDMDFLHPWYYESFHIMIKQPDLDTKVWAMFAQPFSPFLWISIVAAIFLMPAAIICVTRLTAENIPLSFHDYASLLWRIIRSILRQGDIHIPKFASQIWIWGSFSFITVILIQSYCCVILSHLAVQKLKLPFNSIEELIQQTEYKWGMLGGTYQSTLLRTSPLPAFQGLWNGMLMFNATDPDVFTTDHNVLMNKVKSEKFATITDACAIDMEQAKHCEVAKVPDAVISLYYAFPLPKLSPYKALFSHVILDMEERGLLKHYKEKWWPERNLCFTSTSTEVKPISTLVLQPIGLLLCFGVLISFLCLIIEWTINFSYLFYC